MSTPRTALAVGAFAMALTALGMLGDSERALQSYLMAYVFWLDISLGSMALMMIHRLTGGAWESVVHRPLEAAMRALPLLVLLFAPLIVGRHGLYSWMAPGSAAHPELLHAKAWYLNVSFFLGRATLYFVCWLSIAYLLRAWMAEERRAAGDATIAAKLKRLAAVGLILYALTVTLAAVDWVESLEPRFYSTVFGLAFACGQLLAAMAFAVVCAGVLARDELQTRVATPSRFHDLGNLLLMLVLLWGYLGLSQYVTVWVADLPHEIAWYVPRVQTSWHWVGIALVLGNLAIPFAALLLRAVKRRRATLTAVASLLVAAHLVDVFWLVAPSVRTSGFALYWTDCTALVGIGGLWLAVVLRALASPPVPPPAVSSTDVARRHDRSRTTVASAR